MTGQGTRRLTDEQIEKLIAWRERGRGYRWIGDKLGVSAGAVHYQCLKHGAISPRQSGRKVNMGPMVVVASDGRTQRRFTPDEDRRLLELEADGKRYQQIAREMGRPYTSVRIRIMTLAQHEEIAA